MSNQTQKSKKISLDDSLIESANAYLERLPKTANEVIEKWCWIGKAAEKQLTEEELGLLQLNNADIKLSVIPKE